MTKREKLGYGQFKFPIISEHGGLSLRKDALCPNRAIGSMPFCSSSFFQYRPRESEEAAAAEE